MSEVDNEALRAFAKASITAAVTVNSAGVFAGINQSATLEAMGAGDVLSLVLLLWSAGLAAGLLAWLFAYLTAWSYAHRYTTREATFGGIAFTLVVISYVLAVFGVVVIALSLDGAHA